MNSEDYERMKRLEEFDLSTVAVKEFLFLEYYVNESMKNKGLIYIGNVCSIEKIKVINKGTATPKPWNLSEQLVWFKGEMDALVIKEQITKILPSTADEFSLIDTSKYEINKSDSILESLIDSCIDSQGGEATRLNFTKAFSDPLIFTNLYRSSEENKRWANEPLGFVYVMTYGDHENVLKVGYTNREPRIRAAELTIESRLNVPYKVLYAFLTHKARDAEELIHQELEELSFAKEFFKYNTNIFTNAFKKIVIENSFNYLEKAPFFEYSGNLIDEKKFIIDVDIIQEAYEKNKEPVALKRIVNTYESLSNSLSRKFQSQLVSMFGDQIVINYESERNQLAADYEKSKTVFDNAKAKLDALRPGFLKEMGAYVLQGFTLGLINSKWIYKEYESQNKIFTEANYNLESAYHKYEDFKSRKKEYIEDQVNLMANDYFNLSQNVKKEVVVIYRVGTYMPAGFIASFSDGDNNKNSSILALHAYPKMGAYEKLVAENNPEIKNGYTNKLILKFILLPVSIDGFNFEEADFSPYRLDELDISMDDLTQIPCFGKWFISSWGELERYYFSDHFTDVILGALNPRH